MSSYARDRLGGENIAIIESSVCNSSVLDEITTATCLYGDDNHKVRGQSHRDCD